MLAEFGRDGCHRRTSDIRLSFPVEKFFGDDANEGSAHQGATLAGADKLFARNSVHKFQQVAVEIGIPFFARQVRCQGITRKLSPHYVESAYVALKGRQGTEN